MTYGRQHGYGSILLRDHDAFGVHDSVHCLIHGNLTVMSFVSEIFVDLDYMRFSSLFDS